MLRSECDVSWMHLCTCIIPSAVKPLAFHSIRTVGVRAGTRVAEPGCQRVPAGLHVLEAEYMVVRTPQACSEGWWHQSGRNPARAVGGGPHWAMSPGRQVAGGSSPRRQRRPPTPGKPRDNNNAHAPARPQCYTAPAQAQWRGERQARGRRVHRVQTAQWQVASCWEGGAPHPCGHARVPYRRGGTVGAGVGAPRGIHAATLVAQRAVARAARAARHRACRCTVHVSLLVAGGHEGLVGLKGFIGH